MGYGGNTRATLGTFRGISVDRSEIDNFIKSTDKYLKEYNSSDFNSLEFGDTKYLDLHLKNSKKYIFNFKEGTSISVNKKEIIGDLRINNSQRGMKEFIDVAICTNVFAFIDDYSSAIDNLLHLIKPNGLVIGTEPFLTPSSLYDLKRSGDFHRWTTSGIRFIFTNRNVKLLHVSALGNASTSVATIIGLSQSEYSKYKNHQIMESHSTGTGYIIKKSN